MLGAIIGDVAGSIYEVKEVKYLEQKQIRPYEERIKILDKSVPLFDKNSSFTDDSILTCAIASTIVSHHYDLEDNNYEKSLRLFGNKELEKGLDKYNRNPFGSSFTNWLKEENIGRSIGNGGAMRVSPIGFYYNNIDEVTENAYLATVPSHDSNEAINSAIAIARAIFLLKNKYSKERVKGYLEKTAGYNLDLSLEDLQQNNKFSARADKTIPQAIYCFLISCNFEDAIRKAISIGGDSDTIASITGALCEAHYGLNEELIKQVGPFIPKEYLPIIKSFYQAKADIKRQDRTI